MNFPEDEIKLFEIFLCTAEPVAALQRLMTLLSRNRMVLKKLILNEGKTLKYYEMHILLESNKSNVQKMIKKMEKIIELFKVEMK